jgi:small-conductance mechanosensitive channel
MFGYELPVPAWVAVPAYLVLLLFLCRVASSAIEAVLRRSAARTRTEVDDRIVRAIHGPLVLGLFLGGLRLGLAAIALPAEAHRIGEQVLKLGFIVLLALAVAAIMAADALGISIAPLLTTLGLGSLAVALALQDTLANFFSGLYLLADKPIRVGDYVKLDSGEEGYVHSIGWRSTRIRL